MEFQGDTPYVLVVLTPGSQTAIDLDEPGWMTKYESLMQQPGRWILAEKATNDPVFVMTIREGEEPYYTARVVGVAALPPPDALGVSQAVMSEIRAKAEIRAYGIGKTRLDGAVDRLWVLPNKVVCVGDDVDDLGSEMAKLRLHGLLRSVNYGNKEIQEKRAVKRAVKRKRPTRSQRSQP